MMESITEELKSFKQQLSEGRRNWRISTMKRIKRIGKKRMRKKRMRKKRMRKKRMRKKRMRKKRMRKKRMTRLWNCRIFGALDRLY
jgi:hypothetical protein